MVAGSKDLEQKAVRVDGWYPREDAVKEIELSRRRFREGEGQTANSATGARG
jgi:inorganic pyrophosphatase